MSEARQREAALQAGQRMIARGERPGYRLRPAEDGRWLVDAMPWLSLTVAEWLDVPPDAFDVETD